LPSNFGFATWIRGRNLQEAGILSEIERRGGKSRTNILLFTSKINQKPSLKLFSPPKSEEDESFTTSGGISWRDP